VSARVLTKWSVLLTKTVPERSRLRLRGRQGGGEKTISHLRGCFYCNFATNCSCNVREADFAASFSRGLGVGLAILVAGTFLSMRLHEDAARIQQVRQNVANIKYAYRKQAAILTCWDKVGLFDNDRPKPLIRMIVLPSEFRERPFDLEFVDRTVEQKQCNIDTNAQNIDIALHEAEVNKVVSPTGSTQLFAAQIR
jgi:hypothetical protein